ncbi:MAG: hypothetical protein IPI87_10350 [Betaproteobacteria bacterium]|nr:hypothetical protein [Betaproteobacteria bacterium]
MKRAGLSDPSERWFAAWHEWTGVKPLVRAAPGDVGVPVVVYDVCVKGVRADEGLD